MSDLPAGWADVDIGAIADIKLGKMLDKAKNKGEPTPYLRNINVRWGNFDLSDILQMPMSPEERSTLSVRDGDILVCEGGEPGRSAVWQNGATDLTFQKALMRLRPRAGIAPHLLTAFLRWSYDAGNLNGHFTGTTIKHLPQGALAAVRFPLPPLSEQQRIVAKIDSLTGKSRRARDHLDHIPRLVEKYKQAILAAAFRGDLTREWRENHCPATLSVTTVSHERRRLLETNEQRLKQCENVSVVETDRPFKLPEGWDWVRAEAICGFITKGTTPGSDLMSSSDGEVPFIKVYNLTFDGTLDFTIDPTFVSNVTHKGFLGRSKVLPGDVLMNIVGPPLGKVSVVPSQYAEWNINQAIAVFRPIASVLPAFLSQWLLTDVLTRWAVSRSKATAGQSNLTLEICRNLPVPLCSYAEQVEIVRKIDTAMSWVNRLAGDANSARKLIDHLDQSVLAKAFKGELVPRDPVDEPASALLERIRAERAAAPKAKRGRKKAA
ncbi:type I restriction enzyme S subunit [Paraburkholderia sp. WSM4175]|uniref:restriction endonuclease subunit S n=1 Tax=Paraburkholderia sp. WSM4175 TaxID=2991072 RepID=UPI003D1C4BC7